MNLRSAVSEINKAGVLLVFPIKNSKEPDSLWSQFFPRKKMVWEWSDESDNRVADLWNLMKRLSDCRQVIYSKWYQGRATFFSIELFTALLSKFNRDQSGIELTPQTRELLDILEMDSPLSTRDVKERSGLQGKINEATYHRSMKELFSRFLIIAYGEVDDGAFPSLAVGATKNLYEEIWNQARRLDQDEANNIINKYMPENTKFRTFYNKVKNK